MNKSKKTTFAAKVRRPKVLTVPMPRSDATIQELDHWILALGGQRISRAEARAWDKEVRWAKIPGEPAPA
jgi:hypothetical protein